MVGAHWHVPLLPPHPFDVEAVVVPVCVLGYHGRAPAGVSLALALAGAHAGWTHSRCYCRLVYSCCHLAFCFPPCDILPRQGIRMDIRR